jgi:serine/threonine-protein kinase HipA
MSVGRLALKDRRIYFEYSEEFLRSNLLLSPFKLPLQRGLHNCKDPLFDGLYGVFADSLPDGWGRLLLDRTVRTFNVSPERLTQLDRLAFVGMHGMGALGFSPEHPLNKTQLTTLSLDMMAENATRILSDTSTPDALAVQLHALAGSSGGARPKILCEVDTKHAITFLGNQSHSAHNRPWIVKFLSPYDDYESGAVEYTYHQMAKDVGLSVPNSHLFPSAKTSGYFGCERFDRGVEGMRIHMHSACGLLHADYRLPALDYDTLLRATLHLTKDMEEVIRLFRIAVFNVIAHNRDDHSRNIAFLMDSNGKWSVAPAYDLTFSAGMGGEHAMMIAGEGKRPTIEHLLRLSTQSGIDRKIASMIIAQTKEVVMAWPRYAKANMISHKTEQRISIALKSLHSVI